VPQTGSLFVDFYFWNRERRNVPVRPYRVLSVSYWHTGLNTLYRKFHVEAGEFDAGWRITVEPVPRSLRHAVQSKLLVEGLPAIRRWLIASPNTGGRAGGHNLVFRFDELANELQVDEKSTIEWRTARADRERSD